MTRNKFIIKVLVPIVCAVIGGGAGFLAGSSYASHQNSAISININNILNDGSTAISPDANLETSTTNLIDAYKDAKQESEARKRQLNDLNDKYSQIQQELQSLKAENESLVQENDKLKTFLLQNNTYAQNIDDLVVTKETRDRLESLRINDSSWYTQVDGVQDYHGDFHSVSYKLHANDTAFVEYKLARKYDLFNANIITTLETGPEALLSVEVYLDDSYITRIDNITRDTNLVPLGPIVVTDVDRLRIKVIKMQGNYRNNAICYITDDSLSVVQ